MDETKYGYWYPPDVSTHGVQIDSLINIVHWFMLLLFVGWGAFFVYCLVKYRARPRHPAAYLPPKAVFTKVIQLGVIGGEALLSLRPALRPGALPHARGRPHRHARGLRQVAGGERAASRGAADQRRPREHARPPKVAARS